MDIRAGTFLWHTVLAGLVCMAWYLPAGLCVMRLLRVGDRRSNPAELLAAPAFGICTLGPLSLAFTSLCGYSRLTLAAAQLLFLICVVAWSRWKRGPDGNPLHSHAFTLRSVLLLLGAILVAAIPAAYLLPWPTAQGLFVAEPLADHFKIAMIDTMAREGLPPLNPFYAPSGKTIVLSYYYLWHFFASQLRVLIGATGWQADVAFTWFTMLSAVGLLVYLSTRLTHARGAGAVCLMLALCGAPTTLAAYMSPRVFTALDMPMIHQLEPLLTQCMWAPQHVLSAIAIVLVVFVLSQMLAGDARVAQGVCIGLAVATAFGCSVWVGGVALLCASPLLLAALLWIRPTRAAWPRLLGALAIALILCVLTSLPLLAAIRSSPQQGSFWSAVHLEIYPATADGVTHQFSNSLLHILLFWIKYLPLSLGLVAVVGWIALLRLRPSDTRTDSFKTLCLASAIGYALVSQFLCSIIRNNDLGWRAILVPLMLLITWSAAWLAEAGSTLAARLASRTFHLRHAVTTAICGAALSIGLAATGAQLWQLHPRNRVVSDVPIPIQPRYRHHEETGFALALQRAWDARHSLRELNPLAMQRKFARQPEVWARARQFCRPDELVLSNPDGYGCVSVFPANLPQSLFADRRTPYASSESASVFAYGHSMLEEQTQYDRVQELFSSSPRIEAIRFVHDTLRVKVLVVDEVDDVWATTNLEASGLFRIVHQDTEFRIYQAR